MKYAVKTDIGETREKNEDNYGIVFGIPETPNTFIIADGMGGHNSGEIASKIAVDFVYDFVISNPKEFSSEDKIVKSIKNLIKKTNDKILKNAEDNINNIGMGTTLITATELNNKLYIGHIGDSRAYVIRDKKIKQITTDHSYIEELIKKGEISRKEADNHPQKNIITRALGSFEKIDVDICVQDLNKDDVILLCTDGLTNMVSDDEILNIVLNNKNEEEICNKLISESIKNGGEDNITVIIIKEF